MRGYTQYVISLTVFQKSLRNAYAGEEIKLVST